MDQLYVYLLAGRPTGSCRDPPPPARPLPGSVHPNVEARKIVNAGAHRLCDWQFFRSVLSHLRQPQSVCVRGILLHMP